MSENKLRHLLSIEKSVISEMGLLSCPSASPGRAGVEVVGARLALRGERLSGTDDVVVREGEPGGPVAGVVAVEATFSKHTLHRYCLPLYVTLSPGLNVVLQYNHNL